MQKKSGLLLFSNIGIDIILKTINYWHYNFGK